MSTRVHVDARKQRWVCYPPSSFATEPSNWNWETMDDLVLEHAARALRKRLVSPLRVEGTDRIGERAFALVVDDGGRRSRIVLDVDPAHATLHLEPVPKREEWRGGFGQRLRGAFLVDARFVPGDRRVELDLAVRTIQPTFRIQAAWHGRGGNLWLLDLGGSGGRPGGGGAGGSGTGSTGAAGASGGAGGVAGSSPGAETAARVLERLADVGPAPDEVWADPEPVPGDTPTASELAARLAGLPVRRWVRELSKELRMSRPAVWQLLVDLPSVASSIDWDQVLQSNSPGSGTTAHGGSSHAYRLPLQAQLPLPGGVAATVPSADPGTALTAAELGLPEAWVSIGELPAFADYEVDAIEGTADPKEDAGRLYWLLSRTYRHLIRIEADAKRRQAYESRVKSERRRIERIGESLRAELSDEEGPMLRTWGEAILSHLHQVKKGDTVLACPNLHDPDGPTLSIPLDPARPATDVAEAYFKRARRWQKGREMR
ncbi:MAG: NFACT family protein, partial [Candidatus Eisenbacteria bacterium]|nr:NFACT family protein [Candidatus Eisenbacteria bacterium]